MNHRELFSKDDIDLVVNASFSGDADDFCKILMTAPEKPLVDVEINSTDAYSDYNIRIIGSRGTYQSTIEGYKIKYLIPEENEERPVIEGFLQDADGNPLYCQENAVFHEESGNFDGDAFSVGTNSIYREIYEYLTEIKDFTYTAENFVEIYRTLETIHAMNPLTRKY